MGCPKSKRKRGKAKCWGEDISKHRCGEKVGLRLDDRAPPRSAEFGGDRGAIVVGEHGAPIPGG